MCIDEAGTDNPVLRLQYHPRFGRTEVTHLGDPVAHQADIGAKRRLAGSVKNGPMN
jgi:hypothetical protein